MLLNNGHIITYIWREFFLNSFLICSRRTNKLKMKTLIYAKRNKTAKMKQKRKIIFLLVLLNDHLTCTIFFFMWFRLFGFFI